MCSNTSKYYIQTRFNLLLHSIHMQWDSCIYRTGKVKTIFSFSTNKESTAAIEHLIVLTQVQNLDTLINART